MIPADFIPPQFRKFETEPMTDEEAKSLYGTCGICDDDGMRNYTVEEIKEKFPKIIGVTDLRNGKFHPNQSKVLFASIEVDLT